MATKDESPNATTKQGSEFAGVGCWRWELLSCASISSWVCWNQVYRFRCLVLVCFGLRLFAFSTNISTTVFRCFTVQCFKRGNAAFLLSSSADASAGLHWNSEHPKLGRRDPTCVFVMAWIWWFCGDPCWLQIGKHIGARSIKILDNVWIYKIPWVHQSDKVLWNRDALWFAWVQNAPQALWGKVRNATNQAHERDSFVEVAIKRIKHN